MPQSLVKNLLHLVFSTKHRQPWLPASVQDSLFAYQAGIFSQLESTALVIGGVEDHVHALFSLSKNYALKKIVEEVKKGSSKWMKSEGTKNKDFHWQNGYAAFSVSESNVSDVRRYIDNQREHHRKMTFQDELRALLTRHGVESDERYVWDWPSEPVVPFQGDGSGGKLVTQGGASRLRRGALPWAILSRPLRGERNSSVTLTTVGVPLRQSGASGSGRKLHT